LNKKITFYLARHGQTLWNQEQRIQGQLDSPLTESGRQQALLLAEQCKALTITSLLTSPLGRALTTAELCAKALALKVKVVSGFEERHFGCWQGKLTTDVNMDSQYSEITAQITDAKPAQGESAKQALQRFQTALIQQLENADYETVLIIIHGELLRCFMGKIKQQAHTATGYDYKNAEIIAITYDPILRQFDY